MLVTPGPKVFTFVLHYGRRGDLKAQLRSAKIADWHDISDTGVVAVKRYLDEALALPDG